MFRQNKKNKKKLNIKVFILVLLCDLLSTNVWTLDCGVS